MPRRGSRPTGPAPLSCRSRRRPLNRFTEQIERFFYRPDEDDAPLPPLPSGDELPPPVEEAAPQELLSFFLEDECYGVPLVLIREIIPVPPLTEVPRAPANLVGVMNLRGEVLPVYDLKVRLKLADRLPPLAGPDADPEALRRGARVVVLASEEGDAGVLVDSVLEVLRVRPVEVEPPPSGLGDRGLVAGLAPRKGGLCIVLDVEQAIA